MIKRHEYGRRHPVHKLVVESNSVLPTVHLIHHQHRTRRLIVEEVTFFFPVHIIDAGGHIKALTIANTRASTLEKRLMPRLFQREPLERGALIAGKRRAKRRREKRGRGRGGE